MAMRTSCALVVVALAGTSACVLRARDVSSAHTLPAPAPATAAVRAADALIVHDVRLQQILLADGAAAASLSFELRNTSTKPAADVVLRISFLSRDTHDANVGGVTTLAAPLMIRTDAPLNAGFAMKYDMTLRNVSSAECRATVAVLSARWLEPSSDTRPAAGRY